MNHYKAMTLAPGKYNVEAGVGTDNLAKVLNGASGECDVRIEVIPRGIGSVLYLEGVLWVVIEKVR